MKNGEMWRLKILQNKRERLKSQILDIGADKYATKMWDKGVSMAIRIHDVQIPAANIIKQEALGCGMDAAVARGVVNNSIKQTDIILLGSIRRLKQLIAKLKIQQFKLPLLAKQLETTVLQADDSGSSKCLRIGGDSLRLDTPKVMGILNVTPDSFSDGSKYRTIEEISSRIYEMIEQGATFIDIGGVSTRPNSVAHSSTRELHSENVSKRDIDRGDINSLPYSEAGYISVQEEIDRIAPAVELAVKYTKDISNVYVSVDTFRHEVAKAAIDIGAHMLNDQYALRFNGSDGKINSDMVDLCRETDVAICMMYHKLSKEIDIVDPISEIENFINDCARDLFNAQIDITRVVIDPGFGFAKRLPDNYTVLKYLSELTSLRYPILVGLSRKSMFKDIADDVLHREHATVAAEAFAVLSGANIIRTHNVGATLDAIKVITQVM